MDDNHAYIFELLLDQLTVAEISKELNLPYSTASDRVKKVRKILQEEYKNIY